MAEKIDFPQIYRNKDGVEIIARNDVQAAAIEREGFEPEGKYVEKPAKQQKTDE